MTKKLERLLLSRQNSEEKARLDEYGDLSDLFDLITEHDTTADRPEECFGCKIGAALDDWYYHGDFPIYTCKLT